MTQDTALDMKDVELNELDQEKIPMAIGAGESPGGGEKNGVVKVKLDEEGPEGGARGHKFTGLSKEELLQVAGTPGWVRVRWALLVLFWLGWAGMLAGAVVIIVQAPRCRPLPAMEWWSKGPLYQLGDPETFQDSNGDGVGDINGIQQRLESLSALKVKGLVIGPLHVTQPDKSGDTNLTVIDQRYGTLDNFISLIEAARKKGVKVILDLTPNYRGDRGWFNETVAQGSDFQSKVKDAMEYWLAQGVAGIYFGSIEDLHNAPDLLSEWRNVTANHSTEGNARVLLAATDDSRSDRVLTLLNQTEMGLLSSRYLLGNDNTSVSSPGERIKQYLEAAGDQWINWAVGGPRVGHMASLVPEKLLRVYHLLLFTLPGTPLTLYGNEIGLKDLPGLPAHSQGPYMQWNDSINYGFSTHLLSRKSHVNTNLTVKEQESDKGSLLTLYKRLSELRGKERSLLHGDFVILHNGATAFAYLRSWDQNERFISALNFDPEQEAALTLKGEDLLAKGSVVLSSNPQRKEGSSLSLQDLRLGPGEALLLKYPYTG